MLKKQSELSFVAGLHRLDVANKQAIFYLMNTSRNRNRWGVTAKALDEALPSLLKKPLGLGKDYVQGHFADANSIDVAAFSAYENKGNYAFGTADFSDCNALLKLEAGDLGPISAVIYPYYSTCSKCEEPLGENWDKHDCIASNQGYAVVHSFEFARFDFVDVPAYPQAGFMNFAGRKDKTVPLTLLAGVYEFSWSPKLQEQKKKVSETCENEKITALEQNNRQLEADLKKAQKDAEDAGKRISELSSKLKAIEDEHHADLVEQAYRARVEAGVAGDEVAEREMLTKQSDDTLKLLASDAKKVASKIVAQGQFSPKTKYSSASQDSLEAAMKAQRARLGYADNKEKLKEES